MKKKLERITKIKCKWDRRREKAENYVKDWPKTRESDNNINREVKEEENN